ncbi:uncharacterized protein LOC130644744 [Hydractinia symbiolongicarpus]|uniref:uncharacterized protein LOC130644744 n=1 Tax=Hydractinia symbiolongicarpus TaxID=13093 RepID=UPI00254BBF61|nr:uncharacterized protein LOC130644744 [Hydractinia symbiolongicarpus]
MDMDHVRKVNIAHRLEEQFISHQHEAMYFIDNLISGEVGRKIFEMTNNDNPVLVAVGYFYFYQLPAGEDLLECVNNALKKSDCSGFMLEHSDVDFSPFEKTFLTTDNFERVDCTFQTDEAFRRDVFQKIANEIGYQARPIAHYLLPFNDVQRIWINKHDDVAKRVWNVLHEWHSKSKIKSWKSLRSLLMHFEKTALIERIETELTQTHAYMVRASEDELCNAVVNMNTTNHEEGESINNADGGYSSIDQSSGDEGEVSDSEDTGSNDQRLDSNSQNQNNNDRSSNLESTDSGPVENQDDVQDDEVSLVDKNKVLVKDLNYKIISDLGKFLNHKELISGEKYCICLARELKFPDNDIKMLKLNMAGGGCPALEFFQHLCSTKADTAVAQLINALKEDDMPGGLESILTGCRDKKLYNISFGEKNELALGLTQSEIGNTGTGDWKSVANYFEYEMDKIRLFSAAINKNASYDSSAVLFDLLQQRQPNLRLVKLAELIGKTTNNAAKEKLEAFILKKASEKKR